MQCISYCSSLIILVLLRTRVVDLKSCAPSGEKTLIRCEVSEDPADCEISKNIKYDGPEISGVTNLTATPFMNRDGKNGVDISWRSPSEFALNKTVGYEMLVQQYDNRIGEVCRYLNVSSERETVAPGDASTVFTYRVDSLTLLDIQYIVRVRTLPRPRGQLDTPEHQFFDTSSTLPVTTTLSPVFALDLKADVSVPYTVTGSFRKTSYFDAHVNNKFSHVSYQLWLLIDSMTIARNVSDQEMSEVSIPVSKDEQFASATFNNVKPGHYKLQYRPMKQPECIEFCPIIPDAKEIKAVKVSVQGDDYAPPNRPKLNISDTNDVTVTYDVAPSSDFIQSYDIVLTALNRPEQVHKEVNPKATEEWHTAKVTFNASKVIGKGQFNYQDYIKAKVVPRLMPIICPKAGECYLKGSCRPCTLSESPLVRLHKDPVNVAVVGGVVGGILLLGLLIIVLLVLVHRRRRLLTGIIGCIKPGSTELSVPADSVSIPEIIPRRQVRVCLAYIRSDMYRLLNDTLRSVLENHFECEVMLYNGSADKSVYESCDYVLVLYSWPLVEAYVLLEEQPAAEMPLELKQCKPVLDLLLRPQPRPTPTVLMVTFDSVPPRNINELTSRNSSLGVYRLPKELEQLAKELQSVNHGAVQQNGRLESWDNYTDSILKQQLDQSIEDVAKYDSGFDSLSMVTRITQGDSISMYDAGPAGALHPHPAAVSTDRTVTLRTIIPRSNEQKYFANCQDSVDNALSSPDETSELTKNCKPFSYPVATNPGYGIEEHLPHAPYPPPSHTIVNVEIPRYNEERPIVSTAAAESVSQHRPVSECESLPSECSYNFSTYYGTEASAYHGTEDSTRTRHDC